MHQLPVIWEEKNALSSYLHTPYSLQIVSKSKNEGGVPSNICINAACCITYITQVQPSHMTPLCCMCVLSVPTLYQCPYSKQGST